MAHNQKASVRVTNNFDGAADITVHHLYSTSPDEKKTFANVQANHSSAPNDDLTVTYNTGFGHFGKDHWVVEAKVKNGTNPGQWTSANATVTLHTGDANKVVNVSVSPTNARIAATTNSGSAGWSVHP